MSSSPRRACPECAREIAVVAGRLSRHDPPAGTGAIGLVSCPGSKRRVALDSGQRTLDGYAVPDFPGQLPLF
ncbi:hypothetical protein [Streptomyces boluensis]|uniref:Uncharacterized protein n=1 Tax=Streptomyces boluensis TaxID=1775135 RepID=A0A964XLP9_9ACTN|nr:hypothetical protein [Streptomyces boluensis]NBE51967.1 hypothetical protein [Streptomyces boluensis]